MRADILAFAAHPDDVELAACGTLMKHIDMGKIAGIVDLTEGQLGSRGTPELRLKESKAATELLGIHFRENLGMEDGWFSHDREHIIPIARVIRKYRPTIVLANAVQDRHPDHGRASKLVSEAAFYSGLVMVETGGEEFEPWRPRLVLNYIQDRAMSPDIVVDISDYMDRKMSAIKAFKSQFFNSDSEEPQTPISTKEFLEVIIGRARDMGRLIGAEFGEGFVKERAVGVEDLTALK